MNAIAVLTTGEHVPLTDSLERARALWRDGRYDDDVLRVEPCESELPATAARYRITLTDHSGHQTVRHAETRKTALAITNDARNATQPDPRFRRSQESTVRRAPVYVSCETVERMEDGTERSCGSWTQTTAPKVTERGEVHGMAGSSGAEEADSMVLALLALGGVTDTQTVTETNHLPKSTQECRGTLIQKGLSL